MNKIFTEEILSFFSQKKTYEEISNILQSRYPGERGYSVKSIKRYCKENGLSPRVSQAHLEQIVATAVQEVGPTYGRKMMTGYIANRDNIRVSHNRVGRALAKAAPQNHQRRRTDTARMVNPIPYRADYFSHKIHYDQNEKLVMYGATHVIAIDGHSRFIVGYSTMPIKNNALIEPLKETFKCVVCQDISASPIAISMCCKQVLGCSTCVDQWTELRCPHCRNEFYETVTVNVFENILAILNNL
ncbi:uncharacterized protein LOC130655589 [Hydractinia symbiolongicarpus]|uniref:uncharacterized protein LOC130655589 n=1 Tax=Hydractinia symbiolongicarpus TaxID=13093 RepID=UPI00254A7C34|nr:uncharacterized protein LOC130655589 [Hydractinia symbiolongicarpus]